MPTRGCRTDCQLAEWPRYIHTLFTFETAGQYNVKTSNLFLKKVDHTIGLPSVIITYKMRSQIRLIVN